MNTINSTTDRTDKQLRTDFQEGSSKPLPHWAAQIITNGKKAAQPNTATWARYRLAKILGEIHTYSRHQEKMLEHEAEEIAKNQRGKIKRNDGWELYLCAKCKDSTDALCDVCEKKIENHRSRSDLARAKQELRARKGGESAWDFTLLKLRNLCRFELPTDTEISEYAGHVYLGGDSEGYEQIAAQFERADTDRVRSGLMRALSNTYPDVFKKVEPKCPVELRGLDQRPIVLGEEVYLLTAGAYKAVKALVDTFPNGISLKQLRTAGSRADKHLRELERDEQWKYVIRTPKGKGKGGYRLIVPGKSPRS